MMTVENMQTALRVNKVLAQLGAVVKGAVSLDALKFDLITYDSRKVKPGSAFFCMPGEKTDGNDFIPDAIASGASCIVSERTHDALSVPLVLVPDVRKALAVCADAFFDSPSTRLRIIGVTGTNGKTTTTHLIENVLNSSGRACGLIGTLGARWRDKGSYGEAKHTTPQAPELQELLYNMHADGCSHLAMEVSSHSLALKRVEGCRFSVAVLTNITQDHLDFHKTMEHYWRSKRLLFESLAQTADEKSLAVLNLDDCLWREFALSVPGTALLTYGYSREADIHVLEEDVSGGLNHVTLHTPAGRLSLSTKLVGRFNVYNLMGAIAVCLHEGISLDDIARSMTGFSGVPGRFETVSRGQPNDPLCIVDYAHTPDGLQNVLKTAADLKKPGAKLIVVFGCGGDRDPSKRPKMGEIAERQADEVIVTSDNPRTENPQEIIANILTGIKRMRKVEVEPDRAAAIRLAVNRAVANDIVVVAGKGHENYQLVMNQVLPFDDKVEILKALEEKGS